MIRIEKGDVFKNLAALHYVRYNVRIGRGYYADHECNDIS